MFGPSHRNAEVFAFSQVYKMDYMRTGYPIDHWRFGPFNTSDYLCSNICYGEWQGAPVRLFDFQAMQPPQENRGRAAGLGAVFDSPLAAFLPGSNFTDLLSEDALGSTFRYSDERRGTPTGPLWTVFEVTLPYGYGLSEVVIEPESLSTAIKAPGSDVDTQSIAFNRTYRVSGHRPTISAVLHPLMIDYLLAEPHLSWHMGQNFVATWNKGVKVTDFAYYLNTLLDVAVLVPDWVGRPDGNESMQDWRAGRTAPKEPGLTAPSSEVGYDGHATDHWQSFGG